MSDKIDLDSLTLSKKPPKTTLSDITNSSTKRNKKTSKNFTENVNLGPLKIDNFSDENILEVSDIFENFEEEAKNTINFKKEKFEVGNSEITNLKDLQLKVDSLIEKNASLLNHLSESINVFDSHIEKVKERFKNVLIEKRKIFYEKLEHSNKKAEKIEFENEFLKKDLLKLEKENEELFSENSNLKLYKEGYFKLKEMYRNLKKE